MDNKIVFIENIGTVEYKKSAVSKHLKISVRDKDSILVSIPKHISFGDAEKFVLSKMEWIKKSLQKLSVVTKKQTIFTADSNFSSKFRTMKLIPENRTNLRLKILDGYFEIYYPQNADMESETLQSAVRKLVEHVWKVEAYEYLPKRIKHIAQLCNLTFKSLVIKNTRSFWGQCSGDNAICLSLHLMHLPDHLIDYVILHELCHTIHKHHQKEFWQLLDRFTGQQAKALANEMKNYSTRVY
ncbi:MAG: M48 family metallopeptidase [Prevotellaceae bacterium]|nr:M48 family metallopeptidase [Prevotellaceae bacterium]